MGGGWFWSKYLVQNDYYYNNRPKSIPHKCCFTPINLSKQNFIPWKDNFLLLMLSMNCWPILVVYHLSCFWHQRCVVVYWHKRDWLISLLSLPPLIIRGRLSDTGAVFVFAAYLLSEIGRIIEASLKHMTLVKKWTSCFGADHVRKEKIDYFIKLHLLVIV